MTIAYRTCEVCDGGEPEEIFVYVLRCARDSRRCRDCLTAGNGFGIDEWIYRYKPDGTHTKNPYVEVFGEGLI
jgi:hypothetical protein